jgi:hypothetical protein
MRQLALLFIVIIVIIYFQYGEIRREINSFEILQYQNPEKDLFEKIMIEKKLTIITGLPLDTIKYMNNPIFFITPKLYASLTQQQHTGILKELKHFFSYYYLPMNTKSDLSINYEKRETKTTLKRQPNYRFGICQMLGVKRMYLFPPNSKEDLYYDPSTDEFAVNFWNQDLEKYPNVANAKYIEIPISAGQAIFIPKNWIFCYEMDDNGMGVSFYSESIFSNVLK